MVERRHKRRRYLIHGIQKKYAIVTAVLMVAYTILLSVFIFVPPAIKLSSEVSLEEKADAATQFLVFAEHLWPAIIASIAIVMVISIFIMHRLAGPIYRFEEAAKNLISGDLRSKIRLRKKDDLIQLADLLNMVIDNLNMAMVEIKNAEVEIGQVLEKIFSGLDSKDIDAVRRDAIDINKGRERIMAVLNRFDFIKR